MYHLSHKSSGLPTKRNALTLSIRSARQINCRYAEYRAPGIISTFDQISSLKSHTPHHDLTSYLEYATQNKLDPKSNVYVGTRYEYTVQSAFKRIGMILKRIGGRDDYGTDLIGKWSLPSTPFPLKVLIQCKAHAMKVSPAHARELEGAFAGAGAGSSDSGVLGILVSPKSASKGVRESLGRSHWPMGYALCTRDGKIMQMMWNKIAAEGKLAGIECGLRYTNGDLDQREIVLTWKGKTIY
ncbi:Uncharacterized protein, mitochondrial [Golovinomyces cichoracearum]|uniref:Uncharacterized protein, mitochondrial n=1 Tax=Golovinomyces cichoracearum TaxID=62708 RepID=A0A420IRF5_9PEZI|nr:Uncharacterized protein, mitochondrial [Golovinomyces cichoracearum]